MKEGADYAATYVSWDDAQQFCRRLSQKEGVSYRLPAEAEWEYACCAGTTTKHFKVATVYDLHRNVWEWCQDRYNDRYYATSPIDDPTGFGQGSYRVIRGGSWGSFARGCRSVYRNGISPDYRVSNLDFRLARSQSGK